MKVAFNEPLSWESSKQGPNPEAWKVLPVNFATEHKQMLAHLHMLVKKEYLEIPEQFNKLLISLRTIELESSLCYPLSVPKYSKLLSLWK